VLGDIEHLPDSFSILAHSSGENLIVCRFILFRFSDFFFGSVLGILSFLLFPGFLPGWDVEL